jgi:N-acyl-phosphatidylethanolamine-hydrolysing phospholipase D
MGNLLSVTPIDIPEGSVVPADEVQKQVDANRSAILNGGALPRSKMVDGRFVLDKAIFPNIGHEGTFSDFLKWRRTVVKVETPTAEELEKLPVLDLDSQRLENPPKDKIQVTWIGHASVLVQWDGWNVLADPIFSERCSPVQFAGPARVRPSPVQAEDLCCPIDAVVISHNHYDHLDKDSVIGLAKRHPPPMWFVPLGMKKWMADCGVRNVVEMDWSEEAVLSSADKVDLKVSCLPCQHWCSRTPTDKNKCLWSSWLCSTSGNGANFFFGGDTGYCPMFKKVGDLHGPISFSAIPIGAYGHPTERWFHSPSHMNPEEAVKTHSDLKSKQSLGIHWGTFQLTAEPILEPPQLLKEALKTSGISPDEFVVFKHGETRTYKKE